jgi:hypothetical protein
MFLSELKGHFSPGPQYSIPGCFGGAPANQFASEAKLKADRTRYSGLPPRTSQTLLAAMESGEPCFSLTSGSFCDPLRPLARAMTEHKNSTYWRQATMVQQSERHSTTPATVMESQCPDGGFQALPWTERARGPSLMGDEAQRAERQRLESRGRNVPSPGAPPYRSLEDYVADPPLANVFGATKSRSDCAREPRQPRQPHASDAPRPALLRVCLTMPRAGAIINAPHGTQRVTRPVTHRARSCASRNTKAVSTR